MAVADEVIRAFFAIALPDAARESLERVASPLRSRFPNIRWVTPDRYHVTLLFLGEQKREALEKCRTSVREQSAELGVFEIRLAGFGAFPQKGRPRVLGAGIAGDTDAVEQAFGMCDTAARNAGIRRKREKFHPHVTLGRVRGRPPTGLRGAVEQMPTYTGHAFPVRNVSLFQSTLTSSGPVYEVIEDFPLRWTHSS